ncbi:hypothetical protein EA472_07320 [Natrarchaeobius oligotrophus]|uniref:Uncharacterized protein n=1 Tax=Natrarchaeobius chitinivorans TaxID=1679083 RepID=A0A3N6MJ49_NATCH|nr:hypothetical protein EA472_07320 [Natrarchaeobius chitinivorans]
MDRSRPKRRARTVDRRGFRDQYHRADGDVRPYDSTVAPQLPAVFATTDALGGETAETDPRGHTDDESTIRTIQLTRHRFRSGLEVPSRGNRLRVADKPADARSGDGRIDRFRAGKSASIP